MLNVCAGQPIGETQKSSMIQFGELFDWSRAKLSSAREETVKSEPLDPYRFIHFALHGFYDEEQPARSGIALSVNADSRDDGILQVREIMRLRLRAEMVTL